MLTEQIAAWGEVTFNAGATPERLAALGTALGHDLPNDLGAVLTESDGIEGEYGLGLVWNSDRIATDNARFRTSQDFRDLMPFDGLVFFADAGNGDQFGLSLSGKRAVYVWDHENDSRIWVAPSVMAYLHGWMSGRITV